MTQKKYNIDLPTFSKLLISCEFEKDSGKKETKKRFLLLTCLSIFHIGRIEEDYMDIVE